MSWLRKAQIYNSHAIALSLAGVLYSVLKEYQIIFNTNKEEYDNMRTRYETKIENMILKFSQTHNLNWSSNLILKLTFSTSDFYFYLFDDNEFLALISIIEKNIAKQKNSSKKICLKKISNTYPQENQNIAMILAGILYSTLRTCQQDFEKDLIDYPYIVRIYEPKVIKMITDFSTIHNLEWDAETIYKLAHDLCSYNGIGFEEIIDTIFQYIQNIF